MWSAATTLRYWSFFQIKTKPTYNCSWNKNTCITVLVFFCVTKWLSLHYICCFWKRFVQSSTGFMTWFCFSEKNIGIMEEYWKEEKWGWFALLWGAPLWYPGKSVGSFWRQSPLQENLQSLGDLVKRSGILNWDSWENMESSDSETYTKFPEQFLHYYERHCSHILCHWDHWGAAITSHWLYWGHYFKKLNFENLPPLFCKERV